jgi:predicted O-methyltransferase YrrM
MKFGAIAQNPLEWVALKKNLMPFPLAHTQLMFVLSRAVLCAYKFSLFDAIGHDKVTVPELATKTSLNERALASLMSVLTPAGYFKYSGGRYALTANAKKWCLTDSTHSLHNQQMFNMLCWNWMTHMDDFLQTGKGLQYHDNFNEHEWDLYQKGMESIAATMATEAVKMMPTMTEPRHMLDIGGSHGLYSVELCRKYPSLNAIILDLPEAVAKAAPLLQQYGMGQRVKHLAGNALTYDIGTGEYDLVLISSLIHHFSKADCELLILKAATALKKGGYIVIQEMVRPEPGNSTDMVGPIMDLFFNLSSTAGNWSLPELKAFVNIDGLQFYKANRFISPPGFIQVIGRKA